MKKSLERESLIFSCHQRKFWSNCTRALAAFFGRAFALRAESEAAAGAGQPPEGVPPPRAAARKKAVAASPRGQRPVAASVTASASPRAAAPDREDFFAARRQLQDVIDSPSPTAR